MTTLAGAPSVAVPIAKSVFSAEALAALVQEAYGLADVRCRLLNTVMLDSYEVRAGDGRYFLRVYPAVRSTAEMVLGEMEFLERLDQAGIPVTAPVARADGGRLLALEAPEGTRHAGLFGFAPGQPLHEKIRADNLRAYGALLARLHDAADAMPPIPSRPGLTVEQLVDEPLEELLRALGPRSSAGYMGRYTAEVVRPAIAELSMEAPVYGLCHGDPGTGNAMITSEGRFTLTDFDVCGPSWRAHDLAVVLNDVSDELGKHVLAAYQEVRPLSPEELAAIPHLQAAHFLWVLGMRARHLNEWGEFVFPEGRVIQVFGRVETLVSKLKKGRAPAAML